MCRQLIARAYSTYPTSGTGRGAGGSAEASMARTQYRLHDGLTTSATCWRVLLSRSVPTLVVLSLLAVALFAFYAQSSLCREDDRMPRSSLLNALMRIAADVDSARRPARPVGCGPKIGRRAALRGAAPLAGMVPALAAAEARVAIVGAGLAGLTAAYELSKAGLKPVVHEGSTRLGGRCFSIRSKFLRTDRRAWRRVH